LKQRERYNGAPGPATVRRPLPDGVVIELLHAPRKYQTPPLTEAKSAHHLACLLAAFLQPCLREADLSNRLLGWLLGPELYWFAVYLAGRLLAASTTRGDAAGITLLERASWIVPAITVPLAFAIFYWLAPAPPARGWLTARMMVAAFIGLNAALIAITDAIDYGNSRNSGTWGFWFMGTLLGGLLWVACYLFVVWTGARGRP
jgi:hypothetical protein